MKTPKIFLAIILLTTLLTSCFEDKDDNPVSTSDINDFVYRGMDAFYLYRDLVDDLVEDKANSSEYQNYLNGFNSSFNLFESLIYDRINTDKFSWIVDDYIALEQQFNGTTKSNGMEFSLEPYSNSSNNFFGVVRLVLPNTSAEANGLQRGDLFYAVNGTQLTTNNWRSLLRQDNFTLNLAEYNTNGTATIDDDTIDATPNTIALSRTQYTENPIFKTEILQVEGENVGYLMYNGFVSNFDNALNTAFGEFKANNVQHLVLDLRYNPGGSVNSATLLGSLVTGQFSGQVYAKLQYNSIQQFRNFNYTFVNNNNNNGSTLNNLNLSNVYVLATDASASASEMVINSLSAYINVIHIGTKTVGKSQASVTLYDAPNFTRTNADPRHTYALQPLVAITVNNNDNQVPTQGIIPDIEIEEQLNSFGVLGNENEPLLAEALAHIAANNRIIQTQQSKATKSLFDSKDLLPHTKEMYIER